MHVTARHLIHIYLWLCAHKWQLPEIGKRGRTLLHLSFVKWSVFLLLRFYCNWIFTRVFMYVFVALNVLRNSDKYNCERLANTSLEMPAEILKPLIRDAIPRYLPLVLNLLNKRWSKWCKHFFNDIVFLMSGRQETLNGEVVVRIVRPLLYKD